MTLCVTKVEIVKELVNNLGGLGKLVDPGDLKSPALAYRFESGSPYQTLRNSWKTLKTMHILLGVRGN